MRFRAGLLVGVGIGYVLGTRAGRERYEQIKATAAELRKHPAVSQLVAQGTGVTDLVRNGVASGLTAGSQGLRQVAETPTEPAGNEPRAQSGDNRV